MKALVAVVIGLLVGCSRKPAVPRSSWLIESWDKEVFTIQNEGNVYKATCDGVTSFRMDTSPSMVRLCLTRWIAGLRHPDAS
jgi:hypothetical protein